MTLEQLGEFLFRVARARRVKKISGAKGLAYEVVTRKYPSGGGLFELELYMFVVRCLDLSRGVYRYDPFAHELESLSSLNDAGMRMLRHAQFSYGQSYPPDILFCLAARFARVNWKYEGIAYATILKNAGVLIPFDVSRCNRNGLGSMRNRKRQLVGLFGGYSFVAVYRGIGRGVRTR
jgi:SagB-type dehydrogenase family enzyme